MGLGPIDADRHAGVLQPRSVHGVVKMPNRVFKAEPALIERATIVNRATEFFPIPPSSVWVLEKPLRAGKVAWRQTTHLNHPKAPGFARVKHWPAR